MDNEKIEILERALARERMARKEAENILEQKSLELYYLAQQFKEANYALESLVARKNIELEGVFKNIIDAYCVLDLYGNVLEMNSATYSLLGVSKGSKTINLLEFVAPEEKVKTQEAVMEILKSGTYQDLRVKIISRQGEFKYLHINASLILDGYGDPVAIQGIARDVTQEKIMQNELIESEDRLKLIIQNLDTGVFLEDENRVTVIGNNKLFEMFYIPHTIDTFPGNDITNGEKESKTLFLEPEKFEQRIHEIFEKKEPVIGDELRMVDGKILERNYTPFIRDGVFKGHLWSFKDVTVTKKYSASLEAQKQKFSNIIANMNLGLVEVTLDKKAVFVNNSFEALTGYSESELLGESINDLLQNTTEAKLFFNQRVDETVKDGSNSFEGQIITKQGERRDWLISSAPNYDINGIVIGSIGVVLDITDLKALQKTKEQLLTKLEQSNTELQEYAHIVSHDLKSPLRSIFALVSWLKEDNKDVFTETSLENIQLIEATLEKMELLISDVLNYSSVTSDTLEAKSVDLNLVVEDLHKILYFPDHINLRVINKLPTIQGDQTRLQQLFQNLISNAIRFIDKEKGLIEIDVEEQELYYKFSISDNGVGIEEKYFEKIFMIFQSLNEDKKSSGIGLSIVKKIVDLHKGKIWLNSEVGKGTTFYFTLVK
ncbi:PAS domain-containing sensor histidine kinase [Ulvibacter litoralis]|uniref:histidine kinase n=1 Tax=Ulvibacter litoralis TaxID=227084 RepID=A0A1G7CKE2_9FLAO|nr:PAS domain-containing sensor histidine kinase [Ulvibacter litoralis]GHC47048.1 hypothetical protein GCM10008083_07700 [Ulvibacter litoralis]SDE39711.1 PAS domain S-box-containing protein [Ulvibacter litoralis]